MTASAAFSSLVPRDALQKIQEYGVYGYRPNEVGASIFTAGESEEWSG
jgi:hypothetical protein